MGDSAQVPGFFMRTLPMASRCTQLFILGLYLLTCSGSVVVLFDMRAMFLHRCGASPNPTALPPEQEAVRR